jgi:hypothetical protein
MVIKRRPGGATPSATWVRGVCQHLRKLRPSMSDEECLRLVSKFYAEDLTSEQAAKVIASMLPDK